MGSSIREPGPPSVFGFGQGTQGYQAAPIFMKNGQAHTRTGGPAQSNYEHPMKRVLSGTASSKGGVEPAPYSYQPISFGQPNQQAYGASKYGVARKYGEVAPNTGSQNYNQSGVSASNQAQRNLAQRKARKAQEANFKKVGQAIKKSARRSF
tara:strand:- start:6227 stop:6682 length:456 start_codon:yes stop_codon:yes gene_type:complete